MSSQPNAHISERYLSRSLHGIYRKVYYGKDTVCMSWEDFPEFRKVLVPLRKFTFLN